MDVRTNSDHLAVPNKSLVFLTEMGCLLLGTNYFYSLFKSERLNANIKLTLQEVLVRSLMTNSCHT